MKAATFSRVGDAVGRRQFDVIRFVVTGKDNPPRSPAAAFRDARQFPAAWRGWRQRNGPAVDCRETSPSSSASFGHYDRVTPRSRPSPPRSQPCRGERVARCNPTCCKPPQFARQPASHQSTQSSFSRHGPLKMPRLTRAGSFPPKREFSENSRKGNPRENVSAK